MLGPSQLKIRIECNKTFFFFIVIWFFFLSLQNTSNNKEIQGIFVFLLFLLYVS